MTKKGHFITFEGIDGSGKSTQANLLAARLRAMGHNVLLTREPGGSPQAEIIRDLLVSGATNRWSPETEILLFTAARRDHLEKTVWPALARGDIVICDRFVDSTRVYQGVARSDARIMVDRLHQQMIQQEADLTFLIDADPDRALARGLARNNGEDRFEGFGRDFQKRLRDGFLQLADQYPDRIICINGTQDIDTIAADIFAHMQHKLS